MENNQRALLLAIMLEAYQKHRIAKQAMTGKSKQSFILKVKVRYDDIEGHATITTSWRRPRGSTTRNNQLTIDEFSIHLAFDRIIFHRVLKELVLGQRHYLHHYRHYCCFLR